MKRFRAEFFAQDFAALGFSPIAQPEIPEDYLTPETFEIVLTQPVAGLKQLHMVRIVDGNETVYNGVIFAVDTSTAGMQIVTVASWRIIFDTQYNNFTGSTTLEQQIITFLDNTYYGYTYPNMNLSAFSATSDSLMIDGNIINMMEFTNAAFRTYGITVKIVPDYGNKVINVTVGKPAQEQVPTLEIDTANIVSKDVQLAGGGLKYNRLHAIRFNASGTWLSWPDWFVANNGRLYEYDPLTTPTEGEEAPQIPIIMKLVEVTDEDFTAADMPALAAAELIPSEDDQSIVITVRQDDKLITVAAADIGKQFSMIHNGMPFKGRLSAVQISGETKTLTFGNVRRELTKKLKLQRYKER